MLQVDNASSRDNAPDDNARSDNARSDNARSDNATTPVKTLANALLLSAWQAVPHLMVAANQGSREPIVNLPQNRQMRRKLQHLAPHATRIVLHFLPFNPKPTDLTVLGFQIKPR